VFQELSMKLLIWVCLFVAGFSLPRTVNASFTTANADSEKLPVFIIEFTGLTRKYCTGTFNNISANHKKFITSISISPTEISIPQNNPRIGTAVITLINKDLDVSDFVTQNNLHNIVATIKFGFQSLDDTNFIDFDRWLLSDSQPIDMGTGMVLTFRDGGILATKDVFDFQQSTKQNAGGDNAPPHNTTFTVSSTTGFIDTTNLPNEIEEYMKVGFKAENTTVRYLDVASGTVFGSVGTPNAGFGEPQETIKEASVVKQVVSVHAEDSSLRIFLLHFLLSTDDGTGHAYYDLTSYDSNFKGFGLGLTASDVDVDQIENFMGLVNINSVPSSSDAGNSAGDSIFRTQGEPRNALEFLSEFLNGFGLFMFMGGNGKWKIGTYDSTEIFTTFSEEIDFVEDDVIDFRYSVNWNKLINQMDFSFDTSLLGPYSGDSISKKVTIKLDASVTAYGVGNRNFSIKNDFCSVNTTDNYLKNCYARKWLYTFANPPADWTLSTRAKNIIYTPGDKVKFSLSQEVDTTGASSSRGWSDKKGIITGQNIVFAPGVFDVVFRGILFDIHDEVTGFHTDDTEITSGDMDDSTLDPTGSNTVAINAKHAFIDFSSSLHSSDAFKFTIQWTNPNTGTNVHNLFSIALHVQTAVPATIFTVITDLYVRYYTGDALTITRTFFCVDESLGGTNVEKIKIAAFDLRTKDDAAIAGGDDPSSMTVTSIIRTDLDKTISVV